MKYNSVYYNYASRKLSRMNLKEQIDELGIIIYWCRYLEDDRLDNRLLEAGEHKHTAFELLCMLNGSDTYRIEDETDVISSTGEFLLIKNDVRHVVTERESRCIRFALLFEIDKCSGEQAEQVAKTISGQSYIKGKMTDDMIFLIDRVLMESHDMQALSKQNINNLLIMIISDIARQISSTPIEYYENGKYTSSDLRIDVLTTYINDNISHILTVEDLVSYMYMSPKQLNRIVKKDQGMSVKQYIDYLRCKKAKALLLDTDMYICDISEAVGFTNVNNFNRFFKRIEGMAPGIFRASKGK